MKIALRARARCIPARSQGLYKAEEFIPCYSDLNLNTTIAGKLVTLQRVKETLNKLDRDLDQTWKTASTGSHAAKMTIWWNNWYAKCTPICNPGLICLYLSMLLFNWHQDRYCRPRVARLGKWRLARLEAGGRGWERVEGVVEGTRACTHAVPLTQRNTRSTHAHHPPPPQKKSAWTWLTLLPARPHLAPVAARRRPCKKSRKCNRQCCWPCNTKGLGRRGLGAEGKRVPWRQWRHPLLLLSSRRWHPGYRCRAVPEHCRLSVRLVTALVEQSQRKVEVGCWRWVVCWSQDALTCDCLGRGVGGGDVGSGGGGGGGVDCGRAAAQQQAAAC